MLLHALYSNYICYLTKACCSKSEAVDLVLISLQNKINTTLLATVSVSANYKAFFDNLKA